MQAFTLVYNYRYDRKAAEKRRTDILSLQVATFSCSYSPFSKPSLAVCIYSCKGIVLSDDELANYRDAHVGKSLSVESKNRKQKFFQNMAFFNRDS